MRIVCLQHVPFEGPGAIAAWAAGGGHELERVHLYRSGFPHAATHDAIVVMGGPMSVGDEREHPWLAEEKRFLARAVEDGVPIIGVCLGAQILAEALGGSVSRGPQREIGWFPVRLTDAGRASPVTGVLPAEFEAFHWHGDMFEPPPGAALTAVSDACPSQSFEIDGGRVLALQYHLEIEETGVEQLIAECGAEFEGGPHVQSAPELLADPERFAPAHAMLFDLLDAWALPHADRRDV